MAKINIKDSGKYQQNSNSEFFTLKDDGDTARVRFLYEDPDGNDIDYFLVHEVEIDGKRRYVSCNAVDDEGRMHPEDCPLCKSGNKPKEKLFLQLYDEDDQKLKIWERGKNFVGKIVTYLNRYGALVEQPFDIERRGKKGDTNTTYEMFPLTKDGKTLDDFPEKQHLEGTYIIKVTKQEMYDIIDGVYSTNNQQQQEEQPAPQRQRREPVEEQAPRRSRRRSETDRF